MNRAKEMREIVKSELKYIPRGNEPQNLLRLYYQDFRMHSLGKKAKSYKTRKAVLIEAIVAVQKEYKDFKPKVYEDFYTMPDVPTIGPLLED